MKKEKEEEEYYTGQELANNLNIDLSRLQYLTRTIRKEQGVNLRLRYNQYTTDPKQLELIESYQKNKAKGDLSGIKSQEEKMLRARRSHLLSKILGQKPKKLFIDGKYDIVCPRCNGFAVILPIEKYTPEIPFVIKFDIDFHATLQLTWIYNCENCGVIKNKEVINE